MKYSAIICFIIIALGSSLTGLAQSADGVEYEPVAIDDVNYIITCDWLKQNPFATARTADCTDFFIYEGKLYFNHAGDENEFYLYVVDGETGNYIGRVEIDWNGIEHSPYASYFVGVDSEGTPYVSSYSHGAYQNQGYPFTVTSLSIIAGKPVAQKVFTFPLDTTWWSTETAINGSLNDGNFTLIAALLKDSAKGFPIQWGIGEWKSTDGQPEFVAASAINFRIGLAIPVAGDNVIIYNNDDKNENNSVSEFTSPSLCRLNDGDKPELLDVFEVNSPTATGLDVVEYDDKYFFIYGNSFGTPTTYGVAYLPQYPEHLSPAQKLWTLGGNNPYFSSSHKTSEYKLMSVHADKETSDGLHFYTYTNQEGIAKYTLIQGHDLPTSVMDIKTDNSEEHYSTLTGITLRHKPMTPGVYIRHNDGKSKKVIIKDY